MITEYNTQTGETTEREMTPEEISAMQEMENAPAPVPFEITARQVRMQLIVMGVDLQMIENALEQLPEPQKALAKVNWEYAGTFERNNGMMQEMAVQLGFTDEQIDQIFIEGAKL